MEILTDIIPDILLRQPTKDFVRSSGVCKLWHIIVADLSIRKLHVARHAAASSSEPEFLLVTETREPGRGDKASIFNLSSTKALSQVAIPSEYRFAGVCNDLLCFTHNHDHQAPIVVCNPITGDTLQLPKAPPLPAAKDDPQLSHLFALGFSLQTKEYKIFRLSFPHPASRDETNYMAVYTLGGGGGWRQCSYLSRFHPIQSPAPVHIDGSIFVLTASLGDKNFCVARMLVLDVATESPRSYRIPYNFDNYSEDWHRMCNNGGGFDLLVDGFDLYVQMCLVVPAGLIYPDQSSHMIQFWVMKPPAELEGKNHDDNKLYWDLRYNFHKSGVCLTAPRSVWIDHAQTLCYRIRQVVYTYDTRGYSSSSNVDPLFFDERLVLPDTLRYPSSSSDRLKVLRWSIYGGYRASLFSPLIFALPPSQDEEEMKRPQFEHALLRALKVGLDVHIDGI